MYCLKTVVQCSPVLQSGQVPKGLNSMFLNENRIIHCPVITLGIVASISNQTRAPITDTKPISSMSENRYVLLVGWHVTQVTAINQTTFHRYMMICSWWMFLWRPGTRASDSFSFKSIQFFLTDVAPALKNTDNGWSPSPNCHEIVWQRWHFAFDLLTIGLRQTYYFYSNPLTRSLLKCTLCNGSSKHSKRLSGNTSWTRQIWKSSL